MRQCTPEPMAAGHDWDWDLNDYFLRHKPDAEVGIVAQGERDNPDYYDAAANKGYWQAYATRQASPGGYTGNHPGMIDIQYWFFYPYNGDLSFTMPS